MKLPFQFNKRYKQVGLGIGIICIGAGLIVAWKNTRQRKTLESKEDTPKGRNTTPAFRCANTDYPLSYGTCHPDIKILQRYLKSLGADLGSYGDSGVDGRFGSLTLKAAQAKLGKPSFDRTAIRQLKERLSA